MVERNFIMPDDPVVEIGDIQRSVRPELEIYGPEPGIIAPQEIGFFFGDARRAMFDEGIAVDAAGHHVSNKCVAVKFNRKIVRFVDNHAGDRRRPVAVSADIRGEAKPVVRFAEARIIRATQELIDRRAVTIRGPEIAERIEHQAERVDLPPAILLDARTIRPEPIAVARVHCDAAAVLCSQRRVVVVAMVGVNPAVVTPPEGARQTMNVAVETESAQDGIFPVRLAARLCVLEVIDVRDAERDNAVLIRVKTYRNV